MSTLSSLCDDTRADWGAASPRSAVYTVSLAEKDQFLNHWDGGTALGLASMPHSECLKRVRQIQQQHFGQGWADIGYNTLTCPHGRLIEGRGVLTVGAQCPGYNRSGIGSQLMVGGSDKIPSVMLNRQRKFYDEIVKLRKGEATRKMGHRDGFSTTCPGNEIEAWTKNGMPILGTRTPIPAPLPVDPPRPPSPKIPGPRFAFPLPSGYYFGEDDGSKYSVSGRYGRVFKGRADRAWIQEFASQLTRRGWSVGRGKSYLTRYGNDGRFGDEYVKLVKAFQRDRGLKADGMLGKKTWNAAFNSPVS